MKSKLFSILTVLVVASVSVSPVSARPGIGLTVAFSLGSLIASGTLSRLGPMDVIVALDAQGNSEITCINNGENPVPGQSSPKVSASGSQFIDDADISKNGKAPFTTETDDPVTLPWNEAGCPNSNWTARIDRILWTDAIITVTDVTGTNVLVRQEYTCNPELQTATTVSCELK